MENLHGNPESLILESVIEGMAQYYSANLAREFDEELWSRMVEKVIVNMQDK